ncbi:MAG: inositol monophosphatase [Kiritimatiellae bacterium]|nr:inositol monophosphatase [Kiritimatiellia bacterium]
MVKLKSVEELVLDAAVAVREAAKYLQDKRREIARVTGTEEGGREVKLLADRVTNDILLKQLKETGLTILSEETGLLEGAARTALRWVVDPLDGSVNYLRGIPYCAVSVGLCEGDRPVAGVVYDLCENRLVTGIVGVGAFSEGDPIHVSTVTDPARAVLATGFPARMNYGEASLAAFIGQIRSFLKIRMVGSAVQSCLNVATGRMDAYYERDIMLWDVAAGLAIAEAAGARCEMRPGSREHALLVWACTPGIAEHNPMRLEAPQG